MQVFSSQDVDHLDETTSLLPNNNTNVNNNNENDEQKIDMRSFVTACAANLYEYYDFALLGFFASEISSSLFPDGPGASSIIQLYSLYAVGFIARPFGGIVFGYFGDKYGRKSSLRMAMILMSFPTFLTGCIPGYQYIGWWSPLLLLLLRVLQGLSTGGENSSASIYIYETAPKNKRAFWLSIFGICSSGTLIASISHVILEAALTTKQLYHWGWRIPFLFGIGLFVFSLWAKKWLKTTDTFSHLETSPYIHRNPIKYVCSHNRGLLLKFIFASSLQHGSAYMIFVFLPTYLSSPIMRYGEWVNDYAYAINCINSVAWLPLCILVGYYTDKIGANIFLSISTISVMFVSPFIFYGLSVSRSVYIDWLLQFIVVLACVPMWGSIFYWYISSLLPDPRTRVTIYGVGYNLGAAVFGGTATLIASTFVSSSGPIDGMILSGIWLSVLALLCITCVLYVEFCEKAYKNDKLKSLKNSRKRNNKNNKNNKLSKYNNDNSFTSTWYLKGKYRQLDTINEVSSEDEISISSYSNSSETDNEQENDIAHYDHHKSPKIYG